MSATEILEQIRRLPPAEQHEIVEKIRQEFGEASDDLTPEQIAELERRAAEARAHPERCRPMEEVFDDIEKRYRARQ
jgi:putative addiction module component (TIGR02574 family)